MKKINEIPAVRYREEGLVYFQWWNDLVRKQFRHQYYHRIEVLFVRDNRLNLHYEIIQTIDSSYNKKTSLASMISYSSVDNWSR